MRELLPTIDAWGQAGRGFGRAVLIRAFGSAPRPEGATLLAADDGAVAGSVSGGCVEGAAVEEIYAACRHGYSKVIRYGISDEQAWGVGLACGSTIDVLIEPLLRPEVEEAARAADGRAVITPLPPDAPDQTGGPHSAATADVNEVLTVSAAVLNGSMGDPALDSALVTAARGLIDRRQSSTVTLGDRQFFIETFAQPPRLVVFGADQGAIALVKMARQLGYRTVVADARAAFATVERFPDADSVLVGWPDEVADQIALSDDDAVVVMSHDPKLDEPALVAAIRAGCRYVGAMGSRKTQASRRERLRALGISDEQLAMLRAPIGLDLGGREPAEMALAILAEIVALRNDASAVPLSGKR